MAGHSISDVLPVETPVVSAVIVSYNAGDDLDNCVASVLDQGCSVEIVVVDNGSDDGSVERALTSHPEIRVLSEGVNDGFAGGANRGAATANGKALLFLNPDVTLEPGCLEALILALSGTASGETAPPLVCAPLVADASGQGVEFGLTIDYLGDPVALSSSKTPMYVGGCALATTREVFDRLGGFDGSFFMFCEDLDLCWRALLHGFDVRVVPAARVRHRGGGSTPGGYVNEGRIEITAFRVAMRERNALATIIRCGPALWVALVLPLRLGRIVVIAVIAVLSGRPNLARALFGGVGWNLRRFPELIRQRRAMPATSDRRRRVLRERIRRDVNSARVLLRHGMPRFVDRREQR